MKVFQTVRRNYSILGISPTNQSDRSKCPINSRIFLISFSFGCSVISQMWFIHLANSFAECMECIGSLSAGIIVFVSFAAIVFRKTELFECFDRVEELIRSSERISNHRWLQLNFENESMNILGCKSRKSNALFSKAGCQVERFSQVVFMVMMKVALQCSMLPKCVISLGIYYLTDSGSDSFELPYPMW